LSRWPNTYLSFKFVRQCPRFGSNVSTDCDGFDGAVGIPEILARVSDAYGTLFDFAIATTHCRDTRAIQP